MGALGAVELGLGGIFSFFFSFSDRREIPDRGLVGSFDRGLKWELCPQPVGTVLISVPGCSESFPGL